MKETILFVDDELNLLQGLQRSLRSKRNEWDMTFVSSPHEAISLMKRQCFDVVVTDMRMPEMDGADLLDEVKKICPRSVRIILSGQAETATIIKSIGSAHQYLSKPCDPELLQATINRASKLRRIMGNHELEHFISQLQSIPSQAQAYDKVKEELASNTPSLEIIANTISEDIGMSTKVLQLTNSSFFGQKSEVTSAQNAVRILGIDLLRRLFEIENVFIRSKDNAISTLDLKRLHERGKSVANFAMRVATLEGVSRSAAVECSNTGLVCRIGCIVLALYALEHNMSNICFNEECQASVEVERKTFGTSHSEIGGYLLGLWGLPKQIVDAASRHHECTSIDDDEFSILKALQIGECLASSTRYQMGESLEGFEIHQQYRDRYLTVLKD